MGITRERLANDIDGKEVFLYTLANKNNMRAKITNYGGTLLSLFTTNKDGREDDIVLGYDNFEDYKNPTTYFGAIIGRCANRISKGQMKIDGINYNLYINNGNNHNHGGKKGFSNVVWNSEVLKDETGEYLKLSYFSKDGEENYPGNLNVQVVYRLNDDNEFIINYFGETDRDTVLNLTNHTYFNLSGHASGDVLNQKIKIYADCITPTDSESIPTGEIRNIIGTPMDFTELRAIGDGINSDYDQIILGNGYDHNWILNDTSKGLKKAAEAVDYDSKRMLEVYTTKPGIQLYTGNFIDENEIGKGGVIYNRRHGFCFETQYFPDGVHHENFPSVLLKPGEEYRHTTIFKITNI